MRRLSVMLAGALALAVIQPVTTQAHADPVAQAVADEGTTFVPMPPRRVLDTRDGTGNGGVAQPVGADQLLDLSGTLPASATAVVLNLTGTQPTSNTHIRVSPTNQNVPDISNLNLVAGETRANQVTVTVPANKRIYLLNNAGRVHLIADVAGYYTSETTSSRFTPTTPTRVMDTRTTGAVGPASSVEVNLGNLVPASATSVTFNLTGTQPTSTTYVTAYPTGGTRPDASSLNLVPGQTSPNLVTVALGSDRRVTLYNNLGSTHLIVDVTGYYSPDRGHRFFPVSPVRTYDTRTAPGGPVGPGQSRVVDLASRIAPTAAAAVLNLTAAAPTSVSFVTAHSPNVERPITTSLNLTPGRDTANGAVVALQGDARINLFNNLGSTELIVDVAGFFGTPAPCVADCLYGWGGTAGYGTRPARRSWLSGVTSVDSNQDNAVALKSDGTVWTWGDNQDGQLGAGGTGGGSTVPLRVSGLTDVTAVAMGTWAGYALRSDGTVWAWGSNRYHQLGINVDEEGSNVPVAVWGLTDVTAIAATHQGALALKADGTVWAWSEPWTGVTGGATCPEGHACMPGMPLQVAVPLPGDTRITAIAAGETNAAYALRSDGTAWGWGSNFSGETGTGANPTNVVLSPAQVVGLTGVVTIGGGREVGYASTSDGKVWAWGDNRYGQLGTGVPCTTPETCDASVPVEVKGLTGPVSIDSGGDGTTFALKSDGSVWAWGFNDDSGNLGNGTSCDSPSGPVCRATTPVKTSISGVKDIAAGRFGMFAVVPD
ncbi:RCC1-like domain-containing protein [Lentzea sp. HUAS TT2]|uniref:RCC1-like domain-containing protein n=1 Tax=Lentzea sp. HUAS TT2 TaxID=3447454 RepID=UPI003F6FEDD3